MPRTALRRQLIQPLEGRQVTRPAGPLHTIHRVDLRTLLVVHPITHLHLGLPLPRVISPLRHLHILLLHHHHLTYLLVLPMDLPSEVLRFHQGLAFHLRPRTPQCPPTPADQLSQAPVGHHSIQIARDRHGQPFLDKMLTVQHRDLTALRKALNFQEQVFRMLHLCNFPKVPAEKRVSSACLILHLITILHITILRILSLLHLLSRLRALGCLDNMGRLLYPRVRAISTAFIPPCANYVLQPIIGPSNYAPYAQPGPSYPSTSSSGSSAFDFALSAVDKVAGRKARDQLETGMGSVVHCECFRPITDRLILTPM